MTYRLYALMRDERKIMICEWEDIDFFRRLLTNFEESNNIERFIITDLRDVILEEKVLGLKKEGGILVKRRVVDKNDR